MRTEWRQLKFTLKNLFMADFILQNVIFPSYEWKNIDGFSDEEIQKLQEFLESVAHIIIELAREGGFDNASNF